MKGTTIPLLLAICWALFGCAAEPASSNSAVEEQRSAEAQVDDLQARKRQRSEVEDFLDRHARDSVDAINAGQRAIQASNPQSFYLDTKEIRELGVGPNNHYNYVAVLRYCEVTRCQVPSKSTEMLVLVPRKQGGFNIAHSVQLGATGRINLANDGVIEAISVEFGPDDPPCCPSAQSIKHYKLEGEVLRQAAH